MRRFVRVLLWRGPAPDVVFQFNATIRGELREKCGGVVGEDVQVISRDEAKRSLRFRHRMW